MRGTTSASFSTIFSLRFWILVTFVLQLFAPCFQASNCVINLNHDLHASSPLFLDVETNDVIYPSKSSGTLTFPTGHAVLIHCFGGNITRFNVSTETPTETAKCLGNLNFTVDSLSYSFAHVNCSKHPEPTILTSKNGGVVIGYNKPGNVTKLIDLRHNDTLASTIWAHSKISSEIGSYRVKDFNAPAFSKGHFFKNIIMSKVYPREQQVKTFMMIFNNNSALVNRYLPAGPSRNYFVKGHLVARADHFYHPEQYSTYFYVNVLPMWSSINNGNWKSVETTVRRTAASLGDLDVWTGGIGTLKLSNRDIYLARDAKNKRLVPAPMILFKLVLNEKKNQCLVFLTENNPYLVTGGKICKEYEVCRKKFPQLGKTNEGYTYCCLCQDFLKNEEVKKLGLPVSFKHGVSVLPLS